MIPLSIPSPPSSWAVFHVGPLEIHTYALAILTGIFVGLWIARTRWVARGGDPSVIEEIAIWAVPFGIIGGRLYHVISSPAAYFGEGGHPLNAFRIWEGGLGIWGAIALGAVGAWIGAKRQGVSYVAFMDAAAPGVLVAQAIGRIGNYFNQELFGGPTTLPWGLEIDPYQQSATADYAAGTLFHPTFLYELLWNLAGAVLIVALDRRFRFRHGRAFWLYVLVYTTGRLWIENLRIDEAVHVAGLRINVWVSIFVILLAVTMLVRLGRKYRGEPFDPAPARTIPRVSAVVTDGAPTATKTKPAAKNAPRAAVKAPATGKKTPSASPTPTKAGHKTT